MQHCFYERCQKKNRFMRYQALLTISALCCGATFFITSCKKAQVAQTRTYTYTLYTPVLESRSEIYAGLNGDPNQPIEAAGKIYVDGNYIYVNEVDKGIHVIDNSDPSHPINAAFIRIPGNRDIAIKSNILYADMYSELLAIHIDDIRHVTVASNLTNVFPDRGMPYYNSEDTAGKVIGVTTKDTTVTETIDPTMLEYAYSSMNSSKSQSGNGKAGSMARMVLMKDDLYAIAERHTLSVLNVSEPGSPKMISTVDAGFDLETIFPFENKLFLGSAVGVYMFDVSDQEHPSKMGIFTHGRACDPVIADGHYAYVTLHAGTSCGGDANELDVVDIANLMNPSLMKSYAMTSPKGLSKDGHLLFVCDGDAVKVFDASNPVELKPISQIQCPDAYDIITGDHTAIVVAKKGFYQYDYTDPVKPRPLSVVKTTIK